MTPRRGGASRVLSPRALPLSYGETPLIMCAGGKSVGHEGTLRLLLAKGADANARDHGGLSAMARAIECRRTRHTQALLERNAKIVPPAEFLTLPRVNELRLAGALDRADRKREKARRVLAGAIDAADGDLDSDSDDDDEMVALKSELRGNALAHAARQKFLKPLQRVATRALSAVGVTRFRLLGIGESREAQLYKKVQAAYDRQKERRRAHARARKYTRRAERAVAAVIAENEAKREVKKQAKLKYNVGEVYRARERRVADAQHERCRRIVEAETPVEMMGPAARPVRADLAKPKGEWVRVTREDESAIIYTNGRTAPNDGPRRVRSAWEFRDGEGVQVASCTW